MNALVEAAKILAPLIAGIGIGWRIFVWRHERREHLTVKVANKMLGYDSGHAEWCFGIDAINRGLRAVTIASAGFEINDGTGRRLFLTARPPGATLPGEISGRSSGSTWHPLDDLRAQGLNIYGEIVGFVITDMDHVHRSRPVVLRDP